MQAPNIPERTSSKPIALPDRHKSLMPKGSLEQLNKKYGRAVSAASDMSTLSADSTISDFFERKIKLRRSSMEYMYDYSNKIQVPRDDGKITAEHYENEVKSIDEKIDPIFEELNELKKHRKVLEQDTDESYAEMKKQKTTGEDPVELMESAYATTMVTRAMSCTRSLKELHFNQIKYRAGVVAYLDAQHPDGEYIWCHASAGWYSPRVIKAAHLVPKGLRGVELEFLFGLGEVILSDPRNGITLYDKIEGAMDNGKIVIVPVPSTDESEKTKWRCLLVDESYRKRPWSMTPERVYQYWNELDGRELTFRSSNRPARRYLYFRYIVTYLTAKTDGNEAWTNRVDNRTVFWAIPGSYLEKSTLISMTRRVSGVEIPESAYAGNTFDARERDDSYQDMVLAARLRKTIAESAKTMDGSAEADESEEEDNGDSTSDDGDEFEEEE